jgi:predicted NUDIX family NTP pyrophosphohydrolase
MAISTDRSAGILLYRRAATGRIEVFIGHMGGPFWAHKDTGAWSIPKGLVEADDDELTTALREFEEEVGEPPPPIEFTLLGEFRYTSGKVVTIFAGESDFATGRASTSMVTLEYPKGSGATITFPELDRVEWCSLGTAKSRLVRGQVPAIDALRAIV